MGLKRIRLIREILYKTDDNQFYNALKITFCAVSSFLFFYNMNLVSVAFSFTLGAILCSPIDIDSSLKGKIKGLLISAITIPFTTVFFTLIYKYTMLFYICFGVYIFLVSLLSIYGQRANKFSFTLLLGLSLSFIHITNESDVIRNGLYMFCGGIYYSTISIILYFIMPSRYINIEVDKCITLIAEYLKLKASVWDINANIEESRSKRLVLQLSINDSFQNINQYLEANKFKSANSNHNKKTILTITFLKEIMDTASSLSYKDRSITMQMNKEQILEPLNHLTQHFSDVLTDIATSIKLNVKYISRNTIIDEYEQLIEKNKQFIQKYQHDQEYINEITSYIKKQVTNITSLENIYLQGISINEYNQNISKNKITVFNNNAYQLKTLIDNLNLKSIYFRYALRISIAMLLGLFIGNYIEAKKEYWILLTIVVIMRPGYGLTKTRIKNRIIGTLIGGLIGILILLFIKNVILLSILTTFFMILGYWYTASDYKVGVTFITLFIILIYGILKTDADISVVYRITDTLIGAIIAFLATNYIWPTWESTSIKNNLKQAIACSKNYLQKINWVYSKNENDSKNCIIERKEALIQSGNLMASYQRLIQEPKNKQQNRAELYQITILNQAFVGTLSSLNTYLETNKNIEKQNNELDNSQIENIISNLNTSIELYGNNTSKLITNNITDTNQNNKLETINNTSVNRNILINNQLLWLVNISKQIAIISEKIK